MLFSFAIQNNRLGKNMLGTEFEAINRIHKLHKVLHQTMTSS